MLRHSRNQWLSLICLTLIAPTYTNETAAAEHAAQQWGQWRGPLGTGVAPHADPPKNWSESEGKNIRWKVKLPGKGHSTPIVWNDRIYLTAAVPVGEAKPPKYSGAPGAHDNLPVTHRHQFVVLAVDRRDGKVVWNTKVQEAVPHAGGHNTGSLASGSVATDGEHVIAFFGTQGLYCLDVAGKLLWKKQLGVMQTKHGHGEGASPLLHGNTVVVNWDHEGQSFVAAFDKRSGEEQWKVNRDEVTSWATPIAVEVDDRVQVIVSGTTRLRGYDLSTGKVIWECGGLSGNVVASPVAANGMVFAGSSYEIRAMLAINLEKAKGDITDTDHVAWTRHRGTPYVPSPLLIGDRLFFLRHYQGILSIVDAKTGEDAIGPVRLPAISNVYASPVAAKNRIYISDLDGQTLVVEYGEAPRVLALNDLEESIAASIAIVGRELFVRGEQHLYCIAADE